MRQVIFLIVSRQLGGNSPEMVCKAPSKGAPQNRRFVGVAYAAVPDLQELALQNLFLTANRIER